MSYGLRLRSLGVDGRAMLIVMRRDCNIAMIGFFMMRRFVDNLCHFRIHSSIRQIYTMINIITRDNFMGFFFF